MDACFKGTRKLSNSACQRACSGLATAALSSLVDSRQHRLGNRQAHQQRQGTLARVTLIRGRCEFSEAAAAAAAVATAA